MTTFAEHSARLRAACRAQGYTADPVCSWCDTEVPVQEWSEHRKHCAQRPLQHPAVCPAGSASRPSTSTEPS